MRKLSLDKLNSLDTLHCKVVIGQDLEHISLKKKINIQILIKVCGYST